MMKNKILAAAVLMLPLALFAYFWLRPGAVKMPVAGEEKIKQDAAVAQALDAASPRANAIIASNFAAVRPPQNPVFTAPAKNFAPAGAPAPLEFTNFSASIVLENMRRAVRNYGARFGGNPVGTNPEITRALAGDNPKQVNFLKAEDGLRVNANGELVDPWGTPYFFHQLSGTEMEIHSAGPDKKMWTDDDLVTQ
jgi:hypothetical protein